MRFLIRNFGWLPLGFLVLLASCTPAAVEADVVQSEKPRAVANVSGEETAVLVSNNAAFALDLYQQLRGGNDNLFFSPHSISAALAMTYAGARGETAQQMADTLHFTLPQAQLHTAFNGLGVALTSQADSEDAFQLNIANAIWGQQGYAFQADYLDTLAENYGAGLRIVDFVGETETARQTINDWVSAATEEKIQDLIPSGSLSSLTRLVLTNAIYFNSKWVHPFDPNVTENGRFTLLDGTEISVPMMSQTSPFNYMKGKSYEAIALPYRDSSMEMLLVLPQAGTFDAVEGSFSPTLLADVDKNLRQQQVHLLLPKYTFESEFNLTQTLSGMGMPLAFSSQADFSGMTGDRELSLSEVVHKAFVAVDEEGTEAAAATAVIVGLTSAVEEPLVVRVDRPFLFLIRDTESGAVLFVGRVLDPRS